MGKNKPDRRDKIHKIGELRVSLLIASSLAIVLAGINLNLGYDYYLLFLWLVLVFTLSVDLKFSVWLGLVTLSLSPFLIISGDEKAADVSASVAFIFLLVAGLKSLVDLIVANRATISSEEPRGKN